MAAYASAVTLKVRNVKEVAPGLSVLVGRVNITNYNQTLVAITGISKRFKKIHEVICGPTDTGYILEWIAASNSLKAWTFEDTLNVPVEVASDIDVGEAAFVAFGIA